MHILISTANVELAAVGQLAGNCGKPRLLRPSFDERIYRVELANRIFCIVCPGYGLDKKRSLQNPVHKHL